jgi:hypothetical protein
MEFTVEPFVPGAPGPHVTAAVGAAGRYGAVEMGPFGTRVVLTGESDDGPAACAAAVVRAALAAGATRVSLSVEP